MSNFRRVLSLAAASLLVAAATTASAFINRGQDSPRPLERHDGRAKPPEPRGDLPTVMYHSDEPADPGKRAARRAKNARHDKSHFVFKDIPVGTVVKTTFFSEWDLGLPALPVAQSNLIAIGEVTSAEAHLSNDKSGVYSEFQTNVVELFKNSSGLAVSAGSSLAVERIGGIVQYPNGHKHPYVIAGQNMPRVGRRYVFFLKCAGEGQNCEVVTAYELRAGRVHPLDDVDTFKVYKGSDETTFLEALRNTITTTASPGGRTVTATSSATARRYTARTGRGLGVGRMTCSSSQGPSRHSAASAYVERERRATSRRSLSMWQQPVTLRGRRVRAGGRGGV